VQVARRLGPPGLERALGRSGRPYGRAPPLRASDLALVGFHGLESFEREE
jgi:hypothetical protein